MYVDASIAQSRDVAGNSWTEKAEVEPGMQEGRRIDEETQERFEREIRPVKGLQVVKMMYMSAGLYSADSSISGEVSKSSFEVRSRRSLLASFRWLCFENFRSLMRQSSGRHMTL